jgi:hypothetical protein
MKPVLGGLFSRRLSDCGRLAWGGTKPEKNGFRGCFARHGRVFSYENTKISWVVVFFAPKTTFRAGKKNEFPKIITELRLEKRQFLATKVN